MPENDDPSQKELRAQLAEFLNKTAPKPPAKHRFYREGFALYAKRIVDKVISTKEPHIVALNGGNPITARMQWYQGVKYLREVLDPSYENPSKRIGARWHGDYIEFYYKKFHEPDLSSLPETQASQWKDEFILWMDREKALGEKFNPANVFLTPEDIRWGEMQMNGLEKFYLYVFKQTEVLVIREDVEKLLKQ